MKEIFQHEELTITNPYQFGSLDYSLLTAQLGGQACPA